MALRPGHLLAGKAKDFVLHMPERVSYSVSGIRFPNA